MHSRTTVATKAAVLHTLHLLIISLLLDVGDAFVLLPPPIYHSSTPNPFFCGTRGGLSATPTGRDSHDDNGSDVFVLPIFPLRKSVRLPTDELTLNLHEDRYIALSEFVLGGGAEQQIQQLRRRQGDDDEGNGQLIFGALFCSDKPQIVPGGTGPVTPLLETGDVGCVCTVLEHEDSMVHRSRGGGDELSRRIRLRALAVGRFRVERILSDGYGGGAGGWSPGNGRSNGGFVGCVDGKAPPPYIVCEATRLDDIVPEPGSGESGRMAYLEEELSNLLKEEGGGELLLRDDWMPRDTVCVEAAGSYAKAARSWATLRQSRMSENDDESWDDYRRQLFSFASASALLSGLDPSEAMELMTATSTVERLEFIHRWHGERSTGGRANPLWERLGGIFR